MTDHLDRVGDDAIEDLPPSAKFVYRVLEQEGTLGRQALIQETGLAEGTLDHALGRLQERDLVMATADPGDLRRRVYELVDGDGAGEQRGRLS